MSEAAGPAAAHRIPTYVRRSGRMGPTSQTALVHDVPLRALPTGWWNPAEVFPEFTRIALEIGSGMGEGAVQMAVADPTTALIAAEVHDAGVAATARAADAAKCHNLWIYHGDGLDALTDHIPASTLAEIRIWFPDPWPKRKHHKRRLITAAHVSLMVDRLRLGGVLHTATDVASYADVMQHVLGGCAQLEPVLVGGPRPEWRPLTKFEAAGRTAGRQVVDFRYRKV